MAKMNISVPDMIESILIARANIEGTTKSGLTSGIVERYVREKIESGEWVTVDPVVKTAERLAKCSTPISYKQLDYVALGANVDPNILANECEKLGVILTKK